MKKIVLIIIFLSGLWLAALPKNEVENQLIRTAEISAPVEPPTDFINRTISRETANEAAATEVPQPQRVAPHEQTQSPLNEEVKGLCIGEAETSNFDCYQEYYQQVVASEGTEAAFVDLKKRYQDNSYVQSQCHPLTHVIGNAAAKKFGTVAEAYVEGEGFCWSGYYHGVLEGLIGKIGYQNLPNHMNEICRSLSEQKSYSFDHYNCVHGLGHGVMAVNDNELFDALSVCDALTNGWDRSSCWSGAFMENIIVDNKNHFTNYLKPSDPVYPCNAVGADYRGVCYLMQTSYMLKVTNGDFARVFDLCSEVEEIYRNTCYQSLGRDVSGRNLSQVAPTKAGCVLGKTAEQREHCVIGAVKDFISYFHSDTQARELCAALDEEQLRQTCLNTTEGYYSSF